MRIYSYLKYCFNCEVKCLRPQNTNRGHFLETALLVKPQYKSVQSHEHLLRSPFTPLSHNFHLTVAYLFTADLPNHELTTSSTHIYTS